MREGAGGCCVAARNHGGGAVREAHVGGACGKRHLAADDPRSSHLGAGGTHHVVEASALEIPRSDRADAISVVRISINICDVYIGTIPHTLAPRATLPPTPARP